MKVTGFFNVTLTKEW